MVVVPATSPVTNPVLLTVAMVVADDVHGVEAAGVPEPVNCEVPSPLPQADKVPVIVGLLLTVNVAVVLQLLVLV